MRRWSYVLFERPRRCRRVLRLSCLLHWDIRWWSDLCLRRVMLTSTSAFGSRIYDGGFIESIGAYTPTSEVVLLFVQEPLGILSSYSSSRFLGLWFRRLRGGVGEVIVQSFPFLRWHLQNTMWKPRPDDYEDQNIKYSKVSCCLGSRCREAPASVNLQLELE